MSGVVIAETWITFRASLVSDYSAGLTATGFATFCGQGDASACYQLRRASWPVRGASGRTRKSPAARSLLHVRAETRMGAPGDKRSAVSRVASVQLSGCAHHE
jgi:hypothetical protein